MQKRLTYLKILVSSEIPCLLWGYDAWDYACGEPGERIEQDIIVPDADLDIVSQRLQQEGFILDHNDAVFHQMAGRHLAPDSYPTSVVLEYPHPNVPHPIPKRLNIHPQSCFGFDLHKEKHRFRSVSPKHNEILIPRYHTFLEGIIHYLMNHDPRWSGGVFHLKENTLADLMLELLMNRTDDPKHVVKELTTDVAKWWMEIYFKNGCEDPKREERIEYKEKHRLQGRHLDWKSRWLEPRSIIGVRHYCTAVRLVRLFQPRLARPNPHATLARTLATACVTLLKRRQVSWRKGHGYVSSPRNALL
ncbi:hypothetical protein BKA70DRAFT_1578794 [Coprinopsis sp. MPI-PUGE-AT-0042]|nr:hypothetical protein BKA70DRAFT_1578794 [Coprinopsis sp. MPI-PUGE-AT-0042]